MNALPTPSWFAPVAVVLLGAVLAACDNADSAGQFAPPEITLKEQGELKELMDAQLSFTDAAGAQWIAPKGTLTDGASVPRVALAVTDGRWDPSFLKAAVIHDAYCQSDNAQRSPGQYRTKPWQDVHRMFYEASLAGGTTALTAKIMFAAVWLGGPRWDERGQAIEQMSSEYVTRGFGGSKDWIEENDPSIEAIEAELKQREPLLRNLYQLEVGIEQALQTNDEAQAERLIRAQDRILGNELGRKPNDSMLLLFMGHWHKNQAVLEQRRGGAERANRALEASEAAFTAVMDRTPGHVVALSGLGSVSIVRGDLDRAEALATEALTVAPDFAPARESLRRIEIRREVDDAD